MHKLLITAQCKSNTTTIENEFIDNYMPRANGEYVKVYLYLLRNLNNVEANVTLSHIADYLDHTEKDILRALKYWEKEGLLLISYDNSGNIYGVDIATISVNNVGLAPNTQIPTSMMLAETDTVTTTSDNTVYYADMTNITEPVKLKERTKEKTTQQRKQFKQLLFIAEQYLGKTLSKSDVEMFSYFIDDLDFSTDLVEFLIEYCVENGHQSMHYIRSVALAWSDQSICTVDDAKNQISNFNKEHYRVLKAYGINGRAPVTNEKQYIDKWLKEWGFSIELITEACSRTVASIHQPSFEYTDSILNTWRENNVHYLSDIHKLDEQHYEKKKTRSTPIPTRTNSKTTFSNFEQRDYDINSLEMQLLNN